MFDMGRDGILPAPVSSVHGKRLTPHVAAFITFFAALIIASLSTILLGGFNAFLFTATAATLGTLLVHVLINASMPSAIKNSGDKYTAVDVLLVAAAVIALAFVFYGTFLSISSPVIIGTVVFAAFVIASAVMATFRAK